MYGGFGVGDFGGRKALTRTGSRRYRCSRVACRGNTRSRHGTANFGSRCTRPISAAGVSLNICVGVGCGKLFQPDTSCEFSKLENVEKLEAPITKKRPG